MLINSPNISGSLTVTGNSVITGSLTVLGGINGAITGSAATASYVEYTNVANKPALVSGSSQVTYSGLTGIPSGIVSGSSQVTYSGLSGIPSGIVSGSAQITGFGIFATTGSNQFNGNQAITGSLTTTGTIVAQTLNVQQVTSSIVYSSGSNIFGNSLANTQQFTGSMGVTGSLTVAGAGTFSNTVTSTIFDSTSNAFRLNGNNALSLVTLSGQNVVKINAAGYWGSQIVGANDQGILVNNVGNVGIGTVTPTGRFMLYQSSAGNVFQNIVSNQGGSTQVGINLSPSMTDGEVAANPAQASIYATDSNYGANIIFATKTTGAVGNSLTPRMTLDASGRLGIGNTSPQGLLQIGSNALSNNSDASNAFNLKQTSTTAATGIYLERSGERKGYYMYMGGSLDSLTFQRNNAGTKADVMSLTRDGNVGIENDSPVTKLTLGSYSGARLPYINGTGATFSANGITVTSANSGNAAIGGGLDLTNNTYSVNAYSPIISFSSRSSNGTYNNSYAGIWGQLGGPGGDANWVVGALVFGTAGSYGISERMRINSTGNVGIGLDSVPARLSLVGGSTMQFGIDGNSGNNSIYLRGGTTGDKAVITLNHYGYADYHIAVGYTANTVLSLTKTVGGTDGIIINSSGNVGINTSSPTEGLVVSRGALRVTSQALDFTAGTRGISIDTTDGNLGRIYTVTGTGTATDLALGTNNTERMRITTGGNVSIGHIGDANQRLRVQGVDTGSSNYGLVVADSTTASTMYVRNDGAGYLKASAWSYGSDLRMKENISNVENGIEMVLKMKPKHFDYIDGQKNNLGFIAQDIQEIIPQAVSISDEKTGILALKTDFLVPYLVKAIQELKAENDTLKSRIDTLEQA